MTEPIIHARAVPFEMRATDETDDGLTLEGYASVYDRWYPVTDYLGSYRERIMPGTFARSLRERTPKIQMDHGHDPLIGALPIGVPEEIREDDHGLFVRARLHDPGEDWRIGPIREAIRVGSVDGMSIRFSVPQDRDEWNDDRDERTVRSGILFELGPVVWPASELTEVMVRAFAAHHRDILASTIQSPRVGQPTETQRPTADKAAGERLEAAQPASGLIPQTTRRRVVAEMMRRRSG